ncbi:MAG: methionyl-tRNA formyltransferase [Patescibacteria group bacterium]
MSNKILFFGSGPVAAESLALLVENFEIEAVVTKPQPPHHKEDFPVLKLADKLGLKVYETSDKQDLLDLFATKPATSRLGVVIDYGIIIPQAVIEYFPLGIVNSHFSLLPEWRGADPITFSILSGQKQTGVSLMLIEENLDEGPLLAQAPYDLPDDITTPELTEQLIELSNATLKQILPLYIAGSIDPAPQDQTMAASSEPTYSRKLTKQDSILDFAKSAVQLEREIRAFTGWPRSRTKLGSTDVIISKAHVEDTPGQAGQLWQADNQLGVHTSEGTLIIDRLVPAGKKEMSAEAFLRGHSLENK